MKCAPGLFQLPFWVLLLLASASRPSHALSQYVTFDSETGFSFDSRTSFDFTVSRDGGTTRLAADLSTGTLKLTAAQTTNVATAHGQIRIGDTISVVGLTVPTSVTLQMLVTGTLSGPGATAVAALFVGGPGLGLVGDPEPTVDFESPIYAARGSTVLINDVLQVTTLLTPAQPSFSFMAELDVDVNGPGGTADFGNTATVSLILPQGLTFTSASGTFLTAVPLPAGVWLFSTACVGLALRRRRG